MRLQALGAVDRLLAVRALAHDLDVALGVQDHAKAGADQRLVIHQQHPDRAHVEHRLSLAGQVRADGEAAAFSRACLDLAAVKAHSLAHPDQPVTAA